MNDPLKKYVQHHRKVFDHLDPPVMGLDRLKKQPVPAQVVRTPFLKRNVRVIWTVAASLLIGLVCTYVILDKPRLPEAGMGLATQQPDQRVDIIPPSTSPTKSMDQPINESGSLPVEQAPQEKQIRQVAVVTVKQPIPLPLETRLADSSSASNRLAAILEIEEQSDHLNDHHIRMLYTSMNHDQNTNVRLAALDVLSSNLQNPHVADLLAESLTVQNDPLVQLGIVKVAAQLNHVGIEDALFAVARNPYTFAAVKDEAYAILLNREKL